MGMEFRQLEIDQLTGWHGDNHAEAMRAFLKTAQKMLEKPYKSRPIGGPIEALLEISKVRSTRRRLALIVPKNFSKTIFNHSILLQSQVKRPAIAAL